jgi:riboflavin kinase
MGEGAYYIKQQPYLQQFTEKLGFTPFFGTLNLVLDPHRYEEYLYDSKRFTPVEILGFKNGDRTYGNVFCYRAEIWPKGAEDRKKGCAILRIQRTSHQPNVIEIIAQAQLRKEFQLQDHDEIEFKLITKYENCE